ncbi:MAG: glycogen debranching N-terminal domain-containing protein [Candidatus Melainabacteria bacterium]|nr:glycogen debranching N-terminal domain-containing protein [Candidatus Melainabacteria bacterium]
MFNFESKKYVVDTRPMCQGTQFVLTDAAHDRLVLKHGSHFLVMDESAAIPDCNTLGYGYYRNDTRFLSHWEFNIDDVPLSLLSSRTEDGYGGSFLYTNPQTSNLEQQKLSIQREIVLGDMLWERVTFENYENHEVRFRFNLNFKADFADMFEVRGLNRDKRGERMVPVSSPDGQSVFLAYKGIDGVLMETHVEFHGLRPLSVEDGHVSFDVQIAPKQTVFFETCVSTIVDSHICPKQSEEVDYQSAKELSDQQFSNWKQGSVQIETDNDLFDLSLSRGWSDIYILRQATPKGYGLAAGIPWYCALFGRDSAITALQMLPFAPNLARECIEVMAAYQGQATDNFTEESPGRIMHELRLGELARAKAIPHTPYYGTADATQLWLILFCRYIDWSGDLFFARNMWPAVRQAIQWLDHMSAATGYITYMRTHNQGLENQGWKDSGDSVMYTDGRLGEPPIALCEVQSYTYAARMEVAKIAEYIGHKQMAREQRERARELKTAFQKDFWMAKDNYLALALDRYGKQIGAISSNPGHCLASGILDDKKAHAVADRLMQPDMHTGWGIRTLASSSMRYNPISYHNGSIWPHDNALIAEGLRKIGRVDAVVTLTKEMFAVAQSQADFRLPELYCGFKRKNGSAPISYPVSCSPQAWAAGSMFSLLHLCLNLQADAINKKLSIIEPCLPEWLENVTIKGLSIGQAKVDLSISGQMSFCRVLKKDGQVKVVVES